MIKQLIYVDRNNNNIHQNIKICGQNDFLNIPFLWGFGVVNIFKNYYKFAHELMHLVISFITNGNPKWFSIFPSSNFNKNNKLESYTLGYVRSENIRWYNAFYISMAPLLLIYLSFYIYHSFFNYFEVNIYSYLSYIFIIISLLFSSIPSGADFKILFSSTKYIKVLNNKEYLKTTNKIFNFIPIIFTGAVIYYSLELGL